MATLSGMNIGNNSSQFDSGAAFLLPQKCRISEIVPLDSGYEVEVRQNSPYVITRLKGIQNYSDAFNEGHEAVQQGLDLLSISGKVDLSIRNLSKYLIWWRENGLQVLRIISITGLPITVGSPTIVVHDKNGNVIPQPVPPPLIYHESMRYFRLAQTTDDLFDAFRNMYLSFEQLLEYIEPKLNREGEGHWLKRALETVNNTVPLSRAFSATSADIVSDIYNQIYVDIRCAIFHAKNSFRLFPENLQDKEKVNEGLNKLTRIVLLLMEHWLHARRLGGGVTFVGFDAMTTPLLSNSQVIVSDNDSVFDTSENIDSPTFANSVELTTRYATELSEPGLNFAIGSIDTSGLQNLTKIARLGLKHQNNLSIGSVLEAELTYGAIDRLEVQMGIQLRNVKQPKRLFYA